MPKRSKKSRPRKILRDRPTPGRPPAPRPADPDDWQPATVRVDIGHNVIGGAAHRGRLEDQVVSLVNNARLRAGLTVLRSDERLRDSARGHSTRMAGLGFFAHEDPDGSRAADRMRAAGHPAPGGENIAQGQPGPEAVMQSWLNSPGHRANIVRPEFRTIGVGVRLGPGGPWWTQHFGY